MVQYASTRLIAVATSAMEAAKMAVKAPMPATTVRAVSEPMNIGNIRATRNTPAVTMVDEWIRALTGVGPSMASGSHTWSGNCADLPTAPAKMPMAARVKALAAMAPVTAM